PAPRSPGMLRQYGLNGDEIVLLEIARLIGEKGIRELLVAFGLALRAVPSETAGRCRLLIAGNGPQRGFIESLIRTLGLEGKARIVGGVDYMEIHKLHQLADVFVLP